MGDECYMRVFSTSYSESLPYAGYTLFARLLIPVCFILSEGQKVYNLPYFGINSLLRFNHPYSNQPHNPETRIMLPSSKFRLY